MLFRSHVFWAARSLRLPAEVFRKKGKEMHISVGDIITPEEQAKYRENPATLGKFLRERTYALRSFK